MADCIDILFAYTSYICLYIHIYVYVMNLRGKGVNNMERLIGRRRKE